MHLLDLDVNSGATTTLVGGEDALRSVSYARDADAIAAVRTSWSRPPEICVGTPSSLRQVTAEKPIDGNRLGLFGWSSPITFIKNSHTPVVILQGERDEEVPAPQSFEFYHAMKTLGVPVGVGRLCRRRSLTPETRGSYRYLYANG